MDFLDSPLGSSCISVVVVVLLLLLLLLVVVVVIVVVVVLLLLLRYAIRFAILKAEIFI